MFQQYKTKEDGEIGGPTKDEAQYIKGKDQILCPTGSVHTPKQPAASIWNFLSMKSIKEIFSQTYKYRKLSILTGIAWSRKSLAVKSTLALTLPIRWCGTPVCVQTNSSKTELSKRRASTQSNKVKKKKNSSRLQRLPKFGSFYRSNNKKQLNWFQGGGEIEGKPFWSSIGTLFVRTSNPW